MGHGQVIAEELSVQGGHQQLCGAVHQVDEGVRVDAALARQVKRVRIL